MILPARVTDPDGLPGVAVRVVRVGQVTSVLAYEVVGSDNMVRQFDHRLVTEGWPEEEDPYVAFLRGNS